MATRCGSLGAILSRKGFEGLARVAEALGDLSFSYRIRGYEEELKAKEFFNFGRWQFHKSGDLFEQGGLVANLFEADPIRMPDPFSLDIMPPKKEGKLWSNLRRKAVTISLKTDKDCMMYLLLNEFGFSFSGERIRERRVDRKALFFETVISLGALMAAADGHADRSELEALKSFFKINSSDFPNAASIYNNQLHAPRTFTELLSPFAREFARDDELKEMLFLWHGKRGYNR